MNQQLLQILERKRILPEIYYNPDRKALVDKQGGVYRGLRPRLEYAYFMGYKYIPNPSTTIRANGRRAPPRFSRGPEAGARLGTRVDGELASVVQLLSRLNISIGHYLTTVKRSGRKVHLHKRTIDVLRKLQSRGLRPIVCQLGVGSRIKHTATMLDVLCVHVATGRYVVIEVKSGFTGYHKRSSGARLLAPYTQQNDCPCNQHFLQLFGGMLLFAHTHALNVNDVDGLLIRVDRLGAHVNELPTWVRQHGGASDIRHLIIGTPALPSSLVTVA
jgi:hypothetical protein